MSHAAPESVIHDGKIHLTSPSTGKSIEDLSCTPIGDIAHIVRTTRQAMRVHAERSLEDRARMLRRLGDALLERADALVQTLEQECGKPTAEAWLHEVLPIADLAHYWSTEGPPMLASEEPALDPISYPSKRATVERMPRGVVGLITPWNYPIAIPLRTLFPALLAGNGIIWKPSEYTSRCAQLVLAAVRDVFGPDLVQLLFGGGDVGQALIASNIDGVVFTGGVETGRRVALAAADSLIPVSLELGGKDAAIVLADADIERAARGILWGAMANTGQNCASVERVYVISSIAKSFTDRFVQLAKELKAGRDFGPLVTEPLLRTVEAQVNDARAQGANVLLGGERIEREGRWYAPTILSGVSGEADASTKETFGPTVCIFEVPDEKAAIEAANESAFGLTASVWTQDTRRGTRLGRELKAGVVVVNNHSFTAAIPSLPWSGRGQSGYGITNSPHALDVLTQPRAVVIDRSRSTKEMWWYPYSDALIQAAKSLVLLRRSSENLLTKAKALVALIRSFARRWSA